MLAVVIVGVTVVRGAVSETGISETFWKSVQNNIIFGWKGHYETMCKFLPQIFLYLPHIVHPLPNPDSASGRVRIKWSPKLR